MTPREKLEQLKKPTAKSEIKYRVGSVYDKDRGKATVLSYVDARYVQDTLDNLIGPEFWENRFYEAKGALFCEITINIDGVKISKSDCGTESDIAPAKGEASDAFKRAAVMFGIGRDLYSAETMFADLEKKGSKWVLPRDWKPNNKVANTTPVSPPAPTKVNLKDQEVSNPMYKKAIEDLDGIPLGDDESWDGEEVVKFGKYRNNSGDRNNDITWKRLPYEYLKADWWNKLTSAELKEKCRKEINRRESNDR
tara:strand:+ start:6940 stop:7695 length:756 start_codon:yes stop_codon:yes gene_type:complete